MCFSAAKKQLRPCKEFVFSTLLAISDILYHLHTFICKTNNDRVLSDILSKRFFMFLLEIMLISPVFVINLIINIDTNLEKLYRNIVTHFYARKE